MLETEIKKRNVWLSSAVFALLGLPAVIDAQFKQQQHQIYTFNGVLPDTRFGYGVDNAGDVDPTKPATRCYPVAVSGCHGLEAHPGKPYCERAAKPHQVDRWRGRVPDHRRLQHGFRKG